MVGVTQADYARRETSGGFTGCDQSQRRRPDCGYSVGAPSLGVDLVSIGGNNDAEIERTTTSFARSKYVGLIVTAVPLTFAHADLIISLAARHYLPAVYPTRSFVTAGGLLSYGPNSIEPYRHAAGYVDRILKSEKPGDLPVQAPTRYELGQRFHGSNHIRRPRPACRTT